VALQTNPCNRKVEACDASTAVVDKKAYKRSKKYKYLGKNVRIGR
jgi:hypothetical protein